MVYGRPAIVGSVGMRLSVHLGAGDAPPGGVRILLPRIGVDETCSWSSVLDYAKSARERWSTFAERPGPSSFAAVRGRDPAHVVKVALGEAARFAGGEPSPLTLSVDSEIPIGSGFGSSAATAVGVVAGYLLHRRAEPKRAALDRLVLEVERRQHGLPSGVDHAAVIRGGLLWARRLEDGTTSIEPLAAADSLLPYLRVFDSGPPAEPTGAVVSAVRDRMDADPARTGATLDRMEAATRLFREQLEAQRHDPDGVREAIGEFETCLEELGVVPSPLARTFRRIEAAGGAAKVSGAGTLSGSSAGGVLVYHPDPGVLEAGSLTAGLRELSVQLGAEGLRVESGR